METNAKVNGGKNERASATTMDEVRQEKIAYDYLCRLEEARIWIQACIGEELPSGMDLEEKLRSGVYLAKLGYHIAPEIVPLKKIFDPNHDHYNDRGLQYRHTDNINYWLNALERIGLPSYFVPETCDVYDKRNMPKVIYCLHAVSMYLHKLGRAPKIYDLSGKVHFSSEEISAVQTEFKKYGIEMPAFSKIGGILAIEMPVDDAVQHACILAINEAISQQDKIRLSETLEDPNAGLQDVMKRNVDSYQDFLFNAKTKKLKNAKNKCHDISYVPDVYDELLTQQEIQNCIHEANEMVTIEEVNRSIKTHDVIGLLNALSSLTNKVKIKMGMDIYMKHLSEARERKFNSANPAPLNKCEILAAIEAANNHLHREISIQNSLVMLDDALETRNVNLMLQALKSLPEQLDIHEYAAELYLDEFASIKNEMNSAFTYSEVCGGVKTLSAIALINKSLEETEYSATFDALSNNAAHIGGLNSSLIQHYHAYLLRMRLNKINNGLLPFLKHYEIQECIDLVNKESLNQTAIDAINEAVTTGNSKATWDALSCPEASILCIDADQSELYFILLSREQQTKMETSGRKYLSREDIQDVVNRANKITLQANHACLMIAAINNAIEDGRYDDLMCTLQTMNTCDITVLPHCSQAYIAKFKSQKEKKERKYLECGIDDVDASWVVCSLQKELTYYYNLKTLESSWTIAKSYTSLSKYLHQDDIMTIVAKVNNKYHKEEFKSLLLPLVIRLQACLRGYLVRTAFAKRVSYFYENVDNIIKIQRWWRSQIQRRRCQHKEEIPNKHLETAINEQAAKKIQMYWRAYKMRNDFKVLLHSSNPTISVVQKFVHLLNISDEDYKEELELQKVRSKIAQAIRYNQKLEKEADDMDLKIGMLIKNRITLQEVISQRKHTLSKSKDPLQTCDIYWLGGRKGLKSFSKESRTKLEAYQHLFYTLQTEPSYLAKLLLMTPTGQTSRFVESTILTLYNYGSTPREEYLLLRLFRKALEEEIQGKVDSVLDIITGNSLVIKMIIGYNRSGHGQICLRELLGPLVKDIIEDKTLHINTNPIEVYKFWINEIEAQTGQKTSFPYVVTQNEALTHKEVQSRLSKAIEDLKEKTLFFFDAIIHSLDQIPYSILYMSKVLKNALTVKFPNAAEKEILKAVGNLLYYRYINSAIAAPDAFGIIDIGANDVLNTEQRRNLASIAKLLQFASSGKGFSDDSPHLCLNPFLKKCHDKFKDFFRKACDVVEPEIYFKRDAYSEAALLTYPTVYFTVQELCDIHSLLIEYKADIAPKSTDPLHVLLDDLGAPSTVQSLMGENVETSVSLSRVGQTEICLTLSNKFSLLENDSSDIEKLYTRTKQMVIGLLQYKKSSGTLLSLINAVPSVHEEFEFAANSDKSSDLCISNASDKKSAHLKKYSSLSHLQKELLHNLHALELAGYISKKDGYQTILSDIGKDICNHHYYRQSRKEELLKLENSQRKLDEKTNFCEEKLECYNQYIKKCLDNLSSGNKKVRIRNLFNRSEKHDAFHKICLKYNGAKLREKGVLISIDGLDNSEMKNVTFEISPGEESGVFYVKAKFMGVPVEKVEVDIQDLLQLQYEGVAIMKMFDRTKINVNLLLFLLNSKFYGKGI